MRTLHQERIAYCLPIKAKNLSALREDVRSIDLSGYDFIEWRRDNFESENPQEEMEALDCLDASQCGVIYTFRNETEGGYRSFDNDFRLKRIQIAIQSQIVDYIDVEYRADDTYIDDIKKMLANHSTQLILSYHDFEKTPTKDEIIKILEGMNKKGADCCKIALTPLSTSDLHTISAATDAFSQGVSKPIVAIGMGRLGRITRVFPEVFGGCLTFVKEEDTTAPGQMSIKEIKAQRALLGVE